jgi:hypothetical protein
MVYKQRNQRITGHEKQCRSFIISAQIVQTRIACSNLFANADTFAALVSKFLNLQVSQPTRETIQIPVNHLRLTPARNPFSMPFWMMTTQTVW